MELILHNKGLTSRYKAVIKDILITHENTAHILVEKYILAKDNLNDRYIFLPDNLSVQEKENIINDYLDMATPNLNYVRLIEQAKDIPKEFTLGIKTRLKAKKVAQRLNDEFIKNKNTIISDISFKIEFLKDDNIPPVSLKNSECGNFAYIYNINYLLNLDYIDQIKRSVSLFGWINNNHCMIDLISKAPEVGALEFAITTMSKSSYLDSYIFCHKNQLASAQLYLFNSILNDSLKSIEVELKRYYEVYLKEVFEYPSLKLNIPNQGDTSLNKCRVIFPELDSVIKQYTTYVIEDEINPDYIRLSKTLKLTDGKSLLVNKYYEISERNNEIWQILRNLFASGSLLHHVDPYKDKNHNNLFELLDKEIVEYEKYEDFQKIEIDYLVRHNVIDITTNGIVSFSDMDKIMVLQSLWEYHACSYWHYNKQGRDVLDDMLSKGWLTTSDSLLTTEEKKYFSYYLDNTEFTNGPAYRNHYAHGSSPDELDEEKHMEAYMVFLRLLIILILKIDNDLQLATKAFTIGIRK